MQEAGDKGQRGMVENELKLRLDETLETFTEWLNSRDAVRYRPVSCMHNIFKAHDDSGIGELEKGCKQGGQPESTRFYVQRLTQYGSEVSCFAAEIQYDLFRLKNGVIVTLRWERETAGAVWDLLKRIADAWPETREKITAWQTSDEGQQANKCAQREEWWQSDEVRAVRAVAAEAAIARTFITKQEWAALPDAEQYERVLTYFRGYTPDQVQARKPGLDQYLKSHFFRVKSFAEWNFFICQALEHYPQWAQEEYEYHLRRFMIPEDMALQDSDSLYKWQRWAVMTEAARQDWIAQGGPFEFVEVAWDDLPAKERQAHEDALSAWQRLRYPEEVTTPETEETVSPPVIQVGKKRGRKVWPKQWEEKFKLLEELENNSQEQGISLFIAVRDYNERHPQKYLAYSTIQGWIKKRGELRKINEYITR